VPEHLHSPWRSTYLESPRDGACVFCDKQADPQRDRENLVVWRGRTVFTVLNLYPYNAGHLLVCPYRHVPDLLDLDAAEREETWSAVLAAREWLERAFQPQGYNIGVNLGEAGGAGIASHVHVHVIPRWRGDTNFIATSGDVRVVSKRLEDCFDRLQEAQVKAAPDGEGS